MKQFIHFLIFELKRSIRLKNIILALLFTILALYFVNRGTNIYKNIITGKEDFKKIEKMKMEKAQNYRHMGELGFRVIYVPPPMMVFFYNSGFFSDQNAYMDIGERLNLEISVKGKNMFAEKHGNHRDFCGLFFLFGTLLVLFYGFESFPSIDYLKHLTAGHGFNRVFFPMMFARFVIIGLFFILVMALGILVVTGKGIALTSSDYLFLAAFLGMWLLLSLVLLASGLLVSRIRDKKIGISVIIVIWICLVYVLPMVTDQATADNAKSIPSNFQMELEKWDELVKFEERAKIEVGKYSKEKAKTEDGLNLMESFFKKELLNILAIEKNLAQSLKGIIAIYQKKAVIFPTTFYQSFTLEISGQGYENAVDFLLYLVDLKYRFCQFIKEKRFYSDEKKVEPFIKDGEENMFYASAKIPGTYPAGMILLAIYAIASIMGSYFLFKYAVLNMRTADTGAVKIKKEELDFKKGDQVFFLISKPICKDLLYLLFSGCGPAMRKKGFQKSLIINGTDIVSQQKPARFTYICAPDSLPPDTTVGDFFNFTAGIFNIPGSEKDKIMDIYGLTGLKKKLVSRLEPHERGDMTLALARMAGKKKSDIYLFYNTAMGLGAGFTGRFKDLVEELAQDNALVMYLSTDLEVRREIKDSASLFRYDRWKMWVDDYCQINEKIKEEKNETSA